MLQFTNCWFKFEMVVKNIHQSRAARFALVDIMNDATSAPFTPSDKRPCDASKDKGHSLQSATIANT